MGKRIKQKKYKFNVHVEPSQEFSQRKKLLKKGIDLVDITKLCEFTLGDSGWCNDFNEPDQHIYHIQCWYRNEIIANFEGKNAHVIDDDKYHLYLDDENFIIYRKVKI